MESQNFDILKNFGIDQQIFNNDWQSSKEIYVIQKDPMKKNFSEGAIHKIPSNFLNKNTIKAKDDLEIYDECDQEYSVLDSSTANFNTKIGTSNCFSNLFNSTNQNNCFSSCGNLRSIEENSKAKSLFSSKSISDFNSFTQDKKIEEEKINSKTETNLEQIESNQNSKNDLNMKNGILKNSQEYQMEQLDRIFKEMNESKEAKVIIKAYKSKLKTKFYKVYESNSEFYKEKNKYKIFHKCNFPGCSRTFASAGWLKSHFNEHLQEIKVNKFNIEFERSLKKLRYSQILN